VLLIKIAIQILLTLMFIQDMRSRSVYWVLFPVLGLLFIVLSLQQHHLYTDLLQPTLINMGFLLLQFLLVSAYFSVKNSGWTNITASMLGWGDILFLLSIAFYLSVLNFLFFYIASLVIILLYWLSLRAFSAKKNKHIPLAGLQALLFAVFLTTDWWIKPVNITSDDWLLRIITP
jgi:hypothetical protein